MQTCLKSNEPAIRYGQVRDSLGAGSKVIEDCISGWNRMLELYIESATGLSDYKEVQEFPYFIGLQK